MDNNLVIVARRHGSTKDEIISGPEVSLGDQREKFIALRVLDAHPEFEAVALCRLQVERSHRLEKPEPETREKKSKK